MRRATALAPAARRRIAAVVGRRVAGLARPATHVGLALVAAFGAVEGASFVVKAFAYPKAGYDFAIYFGAALALRDNVHANIYSLHVLQSAAAAHGAALPGALYLYPPVLAVLLIPLTLLPYAAALRLWLLLNLILWVAGTGFLAVELRRLLAWSADSSSPDAPWRHDAAAFSVCVCIFLGLAYGPLMQAFQLGQVTMLIFAIVVAVPFLLRSGHERTAGVLLALATLLKLFPAVLILYFALRGRRRVAVSSIVTMAAAAIALLPLLGPDGFLAAGRVLANGGANAQQFHNQSLARVPLWLAAAFGGTPGGALDALGDVLIVGVVAAFVAVLWRQRGSQQSASAAHTTADLPGYGWAVATMVLASPILWEHHDAGLLPVVVICLGYGVTELWSSPRTPGARRLLALGLGAPVAAYALTASALPLAYDGLTTFSPGPYIAGHPIRPFFMLLRPLAAVLLWVVAGGLYRRIAENRTGSVVAATPESAAAGANVSASAPPRNRAALLALTALAFPAAVIGVTLLAGMVISAAHP